ncbi:MAG: hypothetical protein KDH16_08060, partial [Rhodocyclaceae bacterium]|nr:hypothetical protein [Rhodocyclaceae bacterium]
CLGLLDEIMSYARELDDMGEPTEKIADKNTFHLLDALRYIMSYLRQENKAVAARQAKVKGRSGQGRKISTRR